MVSVLKPLQTTAYTVPAAKTAGSAGPQLTLAATPPARSADALQLDVYLAHRAAEHRLFGRWLAMWGKSPKRVKLTPERLAALRAALVMYDEDQLAEAIDGHAADAWAAGDNQYGRAFDDIAWMLGRGDRVERYSEAGAALREEAEQAAQRRPALRAVGEGEAVQDADAPDPAAVAAARERVRALVEAKRKGL